MKTLDLNLISLTFRSSGLERNPHGFSIFHRDIISLPHASPMSGRRGQTIRDHPLGLLTLFRGTAQPDKQPKLGADGGHTVPGFHKMPTPAGLPPPATRTGTGGRYTTVQTRAGQSGRLQVKPRQESDWDAASAGAFRGMSSENGQRRSCNGAEGSCWTVEASAGPGRVCSVASHQARVC